MKFRIFDHEFEFLNNESQWNKLSSFLHENFFKNKAIIIAVILCIIILFLLVYSNHLNSNSKHLVNKLLPMLYVAVLILIYVLSREAGERSINIFRLDDYMSETGFHETMILLAAFDCITFIPLGFLFERLFLKKSLFEVCFLLLFAVLIELVQFIFARGELSTVGMLMHFLGSILGLLIYKLFRKLTDIKLS